MFLAMSASWSVYLTAMAAKEVVGKYDEKLIIVQRTHSKVSSGIHFPYIAPWNKTIKPLAGLKIS